MYLFVGAGLVAYTILVGKVLKQSCCTSKAQRWFQQKYEDLCDLTGQDIPEDYFYNRLVLHREFLQFKKWLHFYDNHPVFTNIDIIPEDEDDSDAEEVQQEDISEDEASTEEENVEESSGATTEEEDVEDTGATTEEEDVGEVATTAEEKEESDTEESGSDTEEEPKGWLDSLRRLVSDGWNRKYDDDDDDSSSEDEVKREEDVPNVEEDARKVEKDIAPLMDKLSE